MADIGSLLGSAGIGGAIGKAIVSLELETTKYNAELKGAQAQTVASTNAMGSSVSKFGGLASAAFKVFGVAAVAGLAVSVKAAIEADDALLKLQNTYDNNAKLADVSVESFEKQAEALQLLTGTSDEAILTGQALLGQFKVTGQQVQDLTPLVVDLSEKMGIDLSAAAKSVGKAVIGNTAGLQRYGIVIDEASGKGSEFDAVLKGLQGTVGGFAEARAQAEPWRVLGAQFDELAEDVGHALLPVLQNLAKSMQGLVPILQAVADNLAPVVVAGSAIFLWVKWPAIIGAATTAFGALQLVLDSVTVSAIGAATAIGSLIGLLPLAGLGFGGFKEDAEIAGETLSSQLTAFDDANDKLAKLTEMGPLAGAGLGTLAQNAQVVAGDVHDMTDEVVETVNKIPKAFKDTRDALVAEIPALRGTTETWKDTFTLSPSELVKITNSWAAIAKTIARDLRVIGNSDLTPAMKEAISALPPEMRHAFVEGNAKQRQAIINSIKDTMKIEDQIPGLARQALIGGIEIGKNVDAGIVRGIESGQPGVIAAGRAAVRAMIEAANQEAGSHSPSTVMRQLGLDMMTGLYQGITKGAQKAIDAATKEIEKLIDKIGSELDKVKGKAQSFADSIKSGFSGFADIAGLFGGEEFGTDIFGAMVSQVSKAQQLADVLRALGAQGASQATLSQVAGAGVEFGQALLQGGPSLVASMNDSLKMISDLANQTGKGLSEHFFGERIDKLEAKLERQNEILRDIREIERMGHDHAIILDGQVLGKAVRDELVKIGNQNGNALG